MCSEETILVCLLSKQTLNQSQDCLNIAYYLTFLICFQSKRFDLSKRQPKPFSKLEGGRKVWKIIPTVKKLRCKPCGFMINFDRRVKTRAEDHLKTEKHRNHVQLSQRQTYMDSVPDKKNDFFADLTKALVKSNIPLNKVENPNLKSFLEKWTKKELLSESTLRKTYLEDEGKECIQDIFLQIHGKDIYLIIDECTDVLGRYVLAVLVGVLDMHNESKPVLF